MDLKYLFGSFIFKVTGWNPIYKEFPAASYRGMQKSLKGQIIYQTDGY